MFQLILNHQIGATMLAGYAGLAFVNSLPQPVPAGSVFYRFLYDFAHSFWLNAVKLKGLSTLLETKPADKPSGV